MAQAKNGDKVVVHYTGRLTSGEVFDTSYDRDPLEFVIGQNRLIPVFENAIIGMEEGEKKTINVGHNEAYGEYKEDLITVIDKSKLPEDMNPKVGEILQITTQEGSIINFSVIEVNDTSIKLDANHPLAGKDLIFEIELVKIV